MSPAEWRLFCRYIGYTHILQGSHSCWHLIWMWAVSASYLLMTLIGLKLSRYWCFSSGRGLGWGCWEGLPFSGDTHSRWLGILDFWAQQAFISLCCKGGRLQLLFCLLVGYISLCRCDIDLQLKELRQTELRKLQFLLWQEVENTVAVWLPHCFGCYWSSTMSYRSISMLQ